MLPEAVKGFVVVRLPFLTHMKSLFSLYFGRRQRPAILLLHSHRLPISIEEAKRAGRQVNFDFEFCSRKSSFARTAGELPRGGFALFWRRGQSLARGEGAILRKGDVNDTLRADFDFQEEAPGRYNDPIRQSFGHVQLLRLRYYLVNAEQSNEPQGQHAGNQFRLVVHRALLPRNRMFFSQSPPAPTILITLSPSLGTNASS